MKKAYFDYLGVKLGISISHSFSMFAVRCVENLRDWRNGKRKSIPFAIPMVWRGGKDHISGLLFLHDKSKRNKSQEQALCSTGIETVREKFHVPG